MNFFRRGFLSLSLIAALCTGFLPAGKVNASPRLQNDDPALKARQLLANLTPEERVGQLFLVTFHGRQVDLTSQIYDLVTRHSIGGVALRASNDNFTGPVKTTEEIYNLVTSLQTEAWNAVDSQKEKLSGQNAAQHEYIPLFVSIAQEGDGAPNDQILNGMSQLPNQMAIGATWKTDLAEKVGSVLGNELNILGINMLFGPSLDVLDVPQSNVGEDLGTRTFGGDPYWVGEMGQAFIKGVHLGSENQIAVIAKHFPGRGSSDRPPETEIATVRKTLEQLKQIELAPFFAVTDDPADNETTTDGLLVSHIRYWFQGNIRATTRPVSLDSAALEQLMALPQLSEWRKSGGIVVSDDLGSQAVRRFYDPTGMNFDSRQVARDAFLAGNDLLFVDNFTAVGDPDSYTSLLRTIEFFAQKFREDPAFAQRVNLSVERLLTLKYQIYPEFNLDQVLPSVEGLSGLNQGMQVPFEVAQSAATLLSPETSEVRLSLPRPPQNRERIVFFTDVRAARQCSQCIEEYSLAVDAFQNAVVRLYGPRAGSQVQNYQLSSHSFTDLWGLLNGTSGLAPIEEDIRSADWLVFAQVNISNRLPQSEALRRFLSERPELMTNKKIIVFAMNAPYFLDATDISKLSAYYGLYSKSQAFVDAAARILFQELTPAGALPVSVAGVGYDLFYATSPDPGQVIPVYLDISENNGKASGQGQLTVTGTPEPRLFKVGDSLPLITGIIRDRNHNQVPDGTVVRFLFKTGGDVAAVQQIETFSTGGVARATYRIQNEGLLEIRVVSEPATVSNILTLDITNKEGGMITAIAPTIAVTQTIEPTVTQLPTITSTSVPPVVPSDAPGVGSWIVSFLITWCGALGIYFISQSSISTRWSVRWALLSAIGGMAGFFILVLGWPVSYEWQAVRGWTGLIGAILIGMLTGLGVGAAWLWNELRTAQGRKPQKSNGLK